MAQKLTVLSFQGAFARISSNYSIPGRERAIHNLFKSSQTQSPPDFQDLRESLFWGKSLPILV
jgi:hypothetical protein